MRVRGGRGEEGRGREGRGGEGGGAQHTSCYSYPPPPPPFSAPPSIHRESARLQVRILLVNPCH